MAAEVTTTAQAPSEICDEEPVVIVPSAANASFNPARPSAVVSGRTPSSAVTMTGSPRRRWRHLHNLGIETPFALALAARWCDCAENASWSAREMPATRVCPAVTAAIASRASGARACTVDNSAGKEPSPSPAGIEELLAGAVERTLTVRHAAGPYTRQLVSRLFAVTHPQVMAAWRRMDETAEQTVNQALWLSTRADWFTARHDDVITELAGWCRGVLTTPQLRELWARLQGHSSDFYSARHLPGPLPPALSVRPAPAAGSNADIDLEDELLAGWTAWAESGV